MKKKRRRQEMCLWPDEMCLCRKCMARLFRRHDEHLKKWVADQRRRSPSQSVR